MSEFKISQYLLRQEAKRIVEDAIEEESEFDVPALETVQQSCDGHQWVIYTYKAILLCAECDTSEGEAWLEEVGSECDSFGEHASKLAYATLLTACMNEFNKEGD
jgi:hypothetical protein